MKRQNAINEINMTSTSDEVAGNLGEMYKNMPGSLAYVILCGDDVPIPSANDIEAM